MSALFAIPMWLALVAAALINVSYVAGIAYASRAESYNDAAQRSVTGLIQSDEDAKKEDRKRFVLVQAALDSLGQVKIVEKRIEGYNAQLDRAEKEFNQALAEMNGAMPEVPSGYTPDEERELNVLRDKVIVAKERYDAHLSSRGVNHQVARQTETEGEEQP